MRGSGPRGAGRRRTQGRGGGDDAPCIPASLAGCYSAPLKGPLWTCLLLCAALRTLLASPSNEGRVMEMGTSAAPWDGWVRWSLCQPVSALQAPLPRPNLALRLQLMFVRFCWPFFGSLWCLWLHCLTYMRSAYRRGTCLWTESGWGLGSWKPD